MSSSGITIEGVVRRSVTLTHHDLTMLPGRIEDVSTVIPGREGVAVPLAEILASAGIGEGATHLTIEADDDSFAASIPLETVASAVIVYELAGQPLPREKGGPFRLLIPNATRCHGSDVDKCANVKFVGLLRLDAGQGHDTRPVTKDEHVEMHKKPGHEHTT